MADPGGLRPVRSRLGGHLCDRREFPTRRGGYKIQSTRRATRYVVAALLAATGIAVMVFGLKSSRTEQGNADLTRIPVEKIEIENVVRDGRPAGPLRYWAEGQVTPPDQGVRVWLLREDLAQQTGKFTLNGIGHATTDNKGHWKQSIVMWDGSFDIHAVVTTIENEKFYHWAISARQAALAIVQQHNPNTYNVPNWPPLESLPNPRHSDKWHLDV
jgi:hypothetical protein